MTKVDEVAPFEGFGKIPRLARECVITEKLDGTNAQVLVTENGRVIAGSRNRYITPEDDNYGFAAWVRDNKSALLQLGVGRHFGEWWGQGIQRGYGLNEKRFSLFNTSRWFSEFNYEAWGVYSHGVAPSCCHVVPIMYAGAFTTENADGALASLKTHGSRAAEGFNRPEGIIVYHVAAGVYFKRTTEKDEAPKSKANREAANV